MGKIFLGTAWEPAGCLDADGQVHSHQNMAGAGDLGYVSDRGEVFGRGGSMQQLAHVGIDGVVYRGRSANEFMGRVAPDGRVYDSQYGGTVVGHVEAPHINWSGAALLALIR
jgi:hypothetical protein